MADCDKVRRCVGVWVCVRVCVGMCVCAHTCDTVFVAFLSNVLKVLLSNAAVVFPLILDLYHLIPLTTYPPTHLHKHALTLSTARLRQEVPTQTL